MAIALTVVLIPLIVVFQRHHPRDLGLEADGAAAPASQPGAHPDNVVDTAWASIEWTLALALRTSRFWWVFAAYFCATYAWHAVQLYAKSLGLVVALRLSGHHRALRRPRQPIAHHRYFRDLGCFVATSCPRTLRQQRDGGKRERTTFQRCCIFCIVSSLSLTGGRGGLWFRPPPLLMPYFGKYALVKYVLGSLPTVMSLCFFAHSCAVFHGPTSWTNNSPFGPTQSL